MRAKRQVGEGVISQIKLFNAGSGWRRRKIVRRDNGKVVEFEEVKYGMLMMVLCDREERFRHAILKGLNV